LHQANLSMNQLISRKLLGRDATADDAPVILDEFASKSEPTLDMEYFSPLPT
jgi:3-oxoacyl-[acyl-carrier-protein] synthase III